jgi:hypothetical protein
MTSPGRRAAWTNPLMSESKRKAKNEDFIKGLLTAVD